MVWLKDNWLKLLCALAALAWAIYLLGQQWPNIIEFLGGSLIIGGVLAFLGSEAVKSYLGARLETYKSDLLRLTTEHSIKFESLHAERALIIKEIYQLLVSLEDAVHEVVTIIPSAEMAKKEERLENIANTFNELSLFYWRSRIFFDEGFVDQFDALLVSYKSAFLEIGNNLKSSGFESFVDYKERNDGLISIEEMREKLIKPMKKDLENKMRKLLGAL